MMREESLLDLREQILESPESMQEWLQRAIDRGAAQSLRIEIEWSVARELARRKKFRALQVYLILLAFRKSDRAHPLDTVPLDIDTLRPLLMNLLGISRATLWRALKDLLLLGLIYYDDWYVDGNRVIRLFVRDHHEAAYLLGSEKIIGIREVHVHHVASLHNLKALLAVMPATISHPLTKRQIAEQLGTSVRSIKRYRAEFQKEYKRELYEDLVFDDYDQAIEYRDHEKHPDYDGLTFREAGYRTAPVKREDGKYLLWRSSAATVRVNGIGGVDGRKTHLYRKLLDSLKQQDPEFNELAHLELEWEKIYRPKPGHNLNRKICGFPAVPIIALDRICLGSVWRCYLYGPVLEHFERVHRDGTSNGPVPNDIYEWITKEYRRPVDALAIADLMDPKEYVYLKDLRMVVSRILIKDVAETTRTRTAPRIWERWWLRDPSIDIDESVEATDIEYDIEDPPEDDVRERGLVFELEDEEIPVAV